MPVTLIPTTPEKGTAPLFVSVAVSLPLVVPTFTLPNSRLAGLTDAAGVTVSVLDFLMPFAVPDMETFWLPKTLLVATSKGAD